MEIIADYHQIVKEVKERNRLFRTLTEIQALAEIAHEQKDPNIDRETLTLILGKCKKV